MRAAIYHAGGRLTLADLPRPVPGPGELLVRVTACGLCGSDLTTWYQDPRAPMVLGHEPVGVVVAAGEGAPGPVGRRVVVHHHVPCMVCRACRAGRHTLCPAFPRSRIDPGGLAEYVRVPADNARLDTLEIPGHVPDWAATLTEPLGCVLRGQRAAGVGPDSRVLVLGAGSMGLLEVRLARVLGAAVVVAADPRAERLPAALAMGADAALAPDAGPLRDALGGGADQVFVTTSDHDAIRTGLAAAAPGGVVQLFAPTRPGEPVALDLGAVWNREVGVTSTYSAGPFDTRDALRLIAEGAVDPGAVISHRLPMDRAPEAYELARSGTATKVVVEL